MEAQTTGVSPWGVINKNSQEDGGDEEDSGVLTLDLDEEMERKRPSIAIPVKVEEGCLFTYKLQRNPGNVLRIAHHSSQV